MPLVDPTVKLLPFIEDFPFFLRARKANLNVRNYAKVTRFAAVFQFTLIIVP